METAKNLSFAWQRRVRYMLFKHNNISSFSYRCCFIFFGIQSLWRYFYVLFHIYQNILRNCIHAKYTFWIFIPINKVLLSKLFFLQIFIFLCSIARLIYSSCELHSCDRELLYGLCMSDTFSIICPIVRHTADYFHWWYFRFALCNSFSALLYILHRFFNQ